MENKTVKQLKIFLFYFCLILFIFPMFSTINVYADENLIILEVSSTTVESETNFTVSVYDPNIQVGTPYLDDVNILFDDTFYQITPQHENGEIILTAPKVLVNKTYLIEAFTKNQSGNHSITVIPSQNHETNELVITPDSYTIDALKEFSVIVTDKNGQPIENATVNIQDSNDLANNAKTDENGRVFLIAPNKDTIIITAQKIGYNDAKETLEVTIQKDTVSELLSHHYTPIIISMIVLISVIIYVTCSNKYAQKKTHIPNLNKIKQKKQDQQERKDPSVLINQTMGNNEEQMQKRGITVDIQAKPIEKELHISQDCSRNKKKSFRWFSPANDSPKDIKQNQKKKKDESFQGIDGLHRKIDDVIAKQEKEKKYKSS